PQEVEMKTRSLLTVSALLAGVSLLALPVQAQSGSDIRNACETLRSSPTTSTAQNLFGSSVRGASDFCDDRGFSLTGGFDDDWDDRDDDWDDRDDDWDDRDDDRDDDWDDRDDDDDDRDDRDDDDRHDDDDDRDD